MRLLRFFKRRDGLMIALGVVLGMVFVPVCAILWLRLFWGVDSARQPLAAPFNQSDVTVMISRPYLEKAIAGDPKFTNPVVVLGPHPQGGAAFTLTVGYPLPLIGNQDIQAISRISAVGGRLVVTTERVALGSEGQLGVPGSTIETALSAIITNDIARRLEGTKGIIIDIVNVRATNEHLSVDAALRQPGN